MRMNSRWLVALVSLFFCVTVFAANTNNTIPKNISFKLDFSLEQPDEDGIVDQFKIKRSWTTAIGNRRWATLQDKPVDDTCPFVLLTRIESASAKDVTVKFVVLDTDKKCKIVINENNQKIALSVAAIAK
jgi:type 1 fimbria pilin